MKHPLPRLRLAAVFGPAALVALWACGALAQTQPLIAASPPALAWPSSGAKAEQFTLANGLTVIVQPDRRSPTAVQMLWVRVGSIDEVDGTSGVAHLLEHMMFKGSARLKAGEFSRRVAALGGQENAFTSRDYTGYFQQIPAQRLEEVMRLEADRFAHMQWSDAELKRELEVVKEERRLRTDDAPRARLAEQQSALALLVSPYRRPVIGWMNDLHAMTAQDARDFYRRWYLPANAVLVVVGDVSVAQVRALAQKHYGGIAARSLPPRKISDEPEQHGIRRLELKAPAEQALLSLAFRVPRMEQLEGPSDSWALLVLSAVLSGYQGARLERALTQGERRVADQASASYGFSGRGPQFFYLAGVPAAGQSVQAVETALRAEVARIASEGVSAAELARVKTQWVASDTFARDSVMAQARSLGENWIQGLPLDADQRSIARLLEVTPEQVQAVAAKYFGDDQLTVAVLQPQPLDPASRRPAARRGFR